MEQHTTHAHDSHLPFIDAPIVSNSTLMLLTRTQRQLRQQRHLAHEQDAAFEHAVQAVRRLDDLINTARASMLNVWSSKIVLDMALGEHCSDHKNGTHGHDDRPELNNDEHGYGHGEHTCDAPRGAQRDQPLRHAFRIGPAIDLLLAAAALGGSDPARRVSSADRAASMLSSRIARVADLLAAIAAAPDYATAAVGIAQVLATPPTGALAAKMYCYPELGARHADWNAWSIAVEAVRRMIKQGADPVGVAARMTAAPELDRCVASIEPPDLWEPELGGPPVHIVVNGVFPEKQPRGIDAAIGGRIVNIVSWSKERVRLEVPRGCSSGPVVFVRSLTRESTAAIRQSGDRLLRMMPGVMSGSLFSRVDWARISPVASGARDDTCVARVRVGPRLRRFDVTDKNGRLIADISHLRPKHDNALHDHQPCIAPLEAGSMVRVAWEILPIDSRDPQPKASWSPWRPIPLKGYTDLVVPAQHLDLGLELPGVGPLNVLIPAISTVHGPSEVCVKVGIPTRVTFTLTEPAGHSPHIDLDLSASDGRVRIPVSFAFHTDGNVSATFELLAIARPRGVIPERGCEGREGETGLIMSWPDDPPADVFDVIVRGRTVGATSERTLRINIELLGGRWVQGGCLGLVAIHAALLSDGRVLFFGYDAADRNRLDHGHAQTWTASDGAGELTQIGYNPFCSGHAQRADGTLAVVGGHAPDQGGGDTLGWALLGFFLGGGPIGAIAGLFAPQGVGYGDSRKVHIVQANSPAPPRWLALPQMDGGRWYPTCVTLANGDVIIIGGGVPFLDNAWHRVNDDHERIDAAGNLVKGLGDLPEGSDFSPGDDRQLPSSGEGRVPTLYNLALLMPHSDPTHQGNLFLVADALARIYDPQTNLLVGEAIDLGGVRTWWTQTTAVLLPIDIDHNGNPFGPIRILIPGGGTTGRGENSAREGDEGSLDPAIATMTVLDYDLSTGSLQIFGEYPLTTPRVLGDSVMLPDGSILLVNGSARGFANKNREPVTWPDLIKISPNGAAVASSMEDAVIPRGYHSTAILLPDARVAVAGSTGGYSGSGDLTTEDFRVQIFEPPYLSCGTRPEILNAPNVIRYGDRFSVEVFGPASGIRSHVVLLRLSSTTHSLNTDQRLLRLWTEEPPAGAPSPALDVTMVSNPTFAPPGFYMLFALSQEGVPSIGRLVRVGA